MIILTYCNLIILRFLVKSKLTLLCALNTWRAQLKLFFLVYRHLSLPEAIVTLIFGVAT